MPSSVVFNTGLLYAFLLVLARISGAFILVPFPGMQTGSEMPRIVASVAITVALFPAWPHFDSFPEGVATLVLALVVEAAMGLSIGIAVACLLEMLQMGAQIVSQHAGYGFASLIDPTTNTDAGLLVVIAQLVGGLLFISIGIDREVIRIFADSLISRPPGMLLGVTGHPMGPIADQLYHFASEIFSVGLRLALPSIALLGLIDISLALLTRLNAQLQVTQLTFPIKMMAAMLVLAVLAGTYPRMIRSEAGPMLELARRAAGINAHGR